MTFFWLFLAFLTFIIIPLATRGWEGWRYRGISEWPDVEGEFVGGFVDADESGEQPSFRPVLSYEFEAEGGIHHGKLNLLGSPDRDVAQQILEHWLERKRILVAYQPGNPGRNRALVDGEDRLLASGSETEIS